MRSSVIIYDRKRYLVKKYLYDLSTGLVAGIIATLLLSLIFSVKKPESVQLITTPEPKFKFVLNIEEINLRTEIVANVDAAKETEYDAVLKNGIAHARGTGFPGQGKGIYLFAHNDGDFLSLRKLETGDRVNIDFYDKTYGYEVVKKITAKAGDLSWLTKNYGEETLLLQTCWPPGTDWQRIIVVALPVDNLTGFGRILGD